MNKIYLFHVLSYHLLLLYKFHLYSDKLKCLNVSHTFSNYMLYTEFMSEICVILGQGSFLNSSYHLWSQSINENIIFIS